VFKIAGILVVAGHSRIDICELQVSCGLAIMIHKLNMHYALHSLQTSMLKELRISEEKFTP